MLNCAASSTRFDVVLRMRISTVRLEPLLEPFVIDHEFLQREHEQAPGAQRRTRRRGHFLEVAEVYKRVRRHNQIEGARPVLEELRQFALHQVVVDLLGLGLFEHASRQVHAR